MLNLSDSVCRNNLDYFNSLCLEDSEEWCPVKYCEIMPLELVNYAFPRFENKKSNLEFLINPNVLVNYETQDENLEKVLQLIDGFDVISENELKEFSHLSKCLNYVSLLSLKFPLCEEFSKYGSMITERMEELCYLAGEVDSSIFQIDLNHLDFQLVGQREVLADCLEVTKINQQAGWQMFLENSQMAQEYSIPPYLDILKEKAGRVGAFICQSGYSGKFD